MENQYSVWVGGLEVNDYYVSLEEATGICRYWLNKGYDDIQIIKEGE